MDWRSLADEFGLALRRPTRARCRVVYRAGGSARLRQERMFGVDRSGGTPQTQGAPLIGEARREIHEARNAIAAWKAT